MTIKITRLKALKDRNLIQGTLDDIIDIIKSDQLKDLTNTIRNETDITTIKRLKRGLPLFFPTIQCFDKNELSDTNVPTGIVQFDVDLKDNLETDFDILKAEITSIPEVIYAFISPQGGLKFGVMTDFHKHDGEERSVMKDRYKKAYDIVDARLLNGLGVNLDRNVRVVKCGCFLSCDENVYLNTDCTVLIVDSECSQTIISTPEDQPERPVYRSMETSQDANYIMHLLSFVPKNFSYNDRLPINYTVLYQLGPSGIALLLDHWDTFEAGKYENIERQLQAQLANCKHEAMGTLIRVAKENGYESHTGRHRHRMKAEPSSTRLPDMLNIAQAQIELDHEVKDFFANRTSKIINATCGFGKTKAVLQEIMEQPHGSKVLILAPTIELAEELEQRLQELRQDTDSDYPIIRVIKGRGYGAGTDDGPVCEAPEILKKYEESGVGMPVVQCTKHCRFAGDCRYTRQFIDESHIRIMTHNELVNREAGWFNGGVRGDKSKAMVPSEIKWIPDFMVVDENWHKRDDHSLELNSSQLSILKIIIDCLDGSDLETSIQNHEEQFLCDYQAICDAKSDLIPFLDIDSYISDRKKLDSVGDSPIFAAFHDYLQHDNDPEFLTGIYVDHPNKCIEMHQIKPIAERYKDVPTLFLDATARKMVVQEVVGEIPFVSIQVESDSSINIYQLENHNWSKDQINSQKKADRLVSDIQQKIGSYQNVGLISYKTSKHHDYFAKDLAEKLGIGRATVYKCLAG